MNLRDEFERIMREQREIALATMSDGLPHVRIVNFYYDTETHCVYFVTFKDNEKVVELAANPRRDHRGHRRQGTALSGDR